MEDIEMAFLDKLLGKKQNNDLPLAEDSPQQAPHAAPMAVSAEGASAYTLRAKRGKEGQVLLLVVAGRLDALSSPAFEAECTRYLTPAVRHCILDCQGLAYLSSAGLRSLMTLSMKLRSMNAVLVFSGLTENVQTIFHSAGLLKMFPVYESVEKAVRGIQKG
ncbi:MAG: STAS domain-containing protein [Oceanidesulfovibrio sp.]